MALTERTVLETEERGGRQTIK